MKDNTFLFVGSVATTIGFGNVTPKTQPGQVICIVFAVIRNIFPRKINHILNYKLKNSQFLIIFGKISKYPYVRYPT